MGRESLLKAEILSKGIEFLSPVLDFARTVNAKMQNLCYNLPNDSNALTRPQELILRNKSDGYETVVSCVAPSQGEERLIANMKNGHIILSHSMYFDESIEVDFVKEPQYYRKILSNGEIAKKYVSSCGYDELNILPWNGCAIEKCCSFCGVNTVSNIAGKDTAIFTAIELSDDHSIWYKKKDSYLKYLEEAVSIAEHDEIFSVHLHPIIISGNLKNTSLDFEAEIYAAIAHRIAPLFCMNKCPEGIVAVMEPPPSDSSLILLKSSGISTVVFNTEVFSEPWRSRFCPGKNHFSNNYISECLYRAIPIFGKNNVWTNFVFGLEPEVPLLTY